MTDTNVHDLEQAATEGRDAQGHQAIMDQYFRMTRATLLYQMEHCPIAEPEKLQLLRMQLHALKLVGSSVQAAINDGKLAEADLAAMPPQEEEETDD